MATTITEQKYHDILRQMIKDAGQELIDIADQMVPENLELISDFNIQISFDQEIGSIPEITWTTSRICKNTFDRLMEGNKGK